jgi:hypothetical protein
MGRTQSRTQPKSTTTERKARKTQKAPKPPPKPPSKKRLPPLPPPVWIGHYLSTRKWPLKAHPDIGILDEVKLLTFVTVKRRAAYAMGSTHDVQVTDFFKHDAFGEEDKPVVVGRLEEPFLRDDELDIPKGRLVWFGQDQVMRVMSE